MVDKANKSAALSEARNALTLYVAENAEQVGVRDLILKVTKDDKVNYYFVAKDNLTPVLIEENKPTASTTISGNLMYDEKQYAPYTPTPEGWPSNVNCFYMSGPVITAPTFEEDPAPNLQFTILKDPSQARDDGEE